jgi:DNA mismatch repair protein MLH1
VASLRKRATKQSSADLSKQLKDASFVGVVSHQRSLIQCGEGLMMINHLELAKDLFYQLALARFGGVPMAQLGCGGVNVQTVIAHALQLEDDLILLEHSETTLSQEPVVVNATNENLAQQATACLLDNAGMLEEYFGVRIEEQQQEDDVISVVLTGLPVLLDGHAPEPHGLAICDSPRKWIGRKSGSVFKGSAKNLETTTPNCPVVMTMKRCEPTSSIPCSRPFPISCFLPNASSPMVAIPS